MDRKIKILLFTLITASALVASGIVLATGYLTIEVHGASFATPGGFISPTSTNVAFADIFLANPPTSTEDIIIKKLVITNFGTSSSTPNVFSELRLYSLWPTILLSTATTRIDNDTFIFTDINYEIPTSTSKLFRITGDLGAGATSGETINIGIEASNHIIAEEEGTGHPPVFSFEDLPDYGPTYIIE